MYLLNLVYFLFIFIVTNSTEWRTEYLPRLVLDLLEERGYKVIASTGMGQTMVWTLHISAEEPF